MRRVTFTLGALFISTSILFYYLFASNTLLRCDTYEKCFRHYFFTSFLGIGSFIFTLMTAMLFTMKSNVYSDKRYIQTYTESVDAQKQNASIFSPLVNIGKLLIFTVFCCLITSTIQITLGLFASDLTASIGMSAATTTLALILYSVYQVYKTMNAWFGLLLEKKLPDKEVS